MGVTGRGGGGVVGGGECVLGVKQLLQTAVIVSDARKVRSVVAIGQVLHGEVDRTSLRLADAGGLLQGNLSIVNATDRKSTRLNSSHQIISYAVFCLKKKKHTLLPIR